MKIAGFGNFARPIELTFREKEIGLIYGSNEAGKSTVIAALFAVLYGLSPARKKRYRSWWGGEQFFIELRFREGEHTYRLERNLEKNRVRLMLEGDNRQVLYNDYHLPSEKFDRLYFRAFQEALYLPPMSILQATSVIHEHQLEVQVDADLRRMITGTGETDYEDVLSVLESEYYALTRERLPWRDRGGPRSDQLLEKKKALRQEWMRELELAKQFFAEQHNWQMQLLELEEELQQVKSLLPRLETLSKNLKEIVRIRANLRSLREKKEELVHSLQQVEGLIQQKKDFQGQIQEKFAEMAPFEPEELEQELSVFLTLNEKVTEYDVQLEQLNRRMQKYRQKLEQFPDFSKTSEDIPTLVDRVLHEQEELPELERAFQEADHQYRTQRGRFRWRLWLDLSVLLTALLTAAGTLLLSPFSLIGWSISLLLAFACLVIFIQEVLPSKRKLKQAEKEKDERQVLLNQKKNAYQEDFDKINPYLQDSLANVKIQYAGYLNLIRKMEELDARIQSHQEMKEKTVSEPRYRDLQEKYGAILQRWGRDVLYVLEEYRNLRKRLFAVEQQLSALPPVEKLRADRETLIQEIATLTVEQQNLLNRSRTLQKMLEDHDASEAHLRIDEQMGRLQRKRTELEARVAALRVRIGHRPGMVYHPEKLTANLKELSGEIQQLERRKRALLLAMKVLRESVQKFRNQYQGRIQRELREILERILPQNSLEVQLDARFRLQYRYHGVEITGEQLSSGTRDQLFFAYRLVLSRLLMPLFKFPLIIDDAFVHFDVERKERVFRILQNLKDDYQILIFSSDPQFKKYCDYVIDLDVLSQNREAPSG